LTIGEAEFATWGWRVPFIAFIALLGISVWIRLLVTGFFLPETKDRPLDEQYQD
jgi:MFS family permease